LVFERMPADSLALKLLKRTYRGRAIVIARPRAPCPYIALDDSWLSPEQKLSATMRDELRRARREAEWLGAVTTEIRTPDLRDLAELLDTAFEFEAGDGGDKTHAAVAHDAQRTMFYRQYARAACVEGILRICLLRIGDRVAAAQLAVEHGGGFWLIKVGSDPRFAHCWPGLLLARETIRYAAEAGATSYEFLSTPTDWSAAWTNTARATVSLRVYPFGLRGMAALAVDATIGQGLGARDQGLGRVVSG
jgi:CelD/BcsL family acetyltransferase involved in cellulose biosynthesis